ncbi:MAG TPA: hypothetical protein VHY84_26720 [Bryobacteraceae bacterium]|jgi:hypothetical protein|nr:hypothetical protein [Bryobacteraceae bacterium]
MSITPKVISESIASFFGRPHPVVNRSPLQVGWWLDTTHSAFIWESPRPARRPDVRASHGKSVLRCPAVIDHESRLFEIPCPIDILLRFVDDENQPRLQHIGGEDASIRSKNLMDMISLTPRVEWRHPARPLLQVATPYRFVADEDTYLSQLPPFLHFRQVPWPGLLVTGRMPIHLWPRRLSWAFEWHDTSRELVISRGEPWFYVRFEGNGANRNVKLLEADLTPALSDYCKGLDGVTGFVNHTYSLFAVARQRRPKRLLSPKQR